MIAKGIPTGTVTMASRSRDGDVIAGFLFWWGFRPTACPDSTAAPDEGEGITRPGRAQPYRPEGHQRTSRPCPLTSIYRTGLPP